jgi:hypothetical protein
VPKHEIAARYTASRRHVQGWADAGDREGSSGEDTPRSARAMAKAGVAVHPLNADIAERSWGAPRNSWRSAEAVASTARPTVAQCDDENAADGNPVPPAKRGTAPAMLATMLDFRWNSCRFIATRFR